MRLIMVRHGESEGNVLEQFEGDTKLTKLGLEQAKKIANFLKNERVNVICSSKLIRARETAEKIANELNKKIEFIDGLEEKKWGKCVGMTYGEMDKLQKKLGIKKYDFVPEGGEGWDEFDERIIRVFNGIVSRYEGKDVVIVAHGGFFMNLCCCLFEEKIENRYKFHQGNTCISVLDNESGKWELVKLNCVEHLG